jgi:hypothetical protein
MKASTSLAFQPDGLSCTIDLPLTPRVVMSVPPE